MAKVIFKDDNSLQDATDKTKGTINFRKTKSGDIIAAAAPMRKKKRSKK